MLWRRITASPQTTQVSPIRASLITSPCSGATSSESATPTRTGSRDTRSTPTTRCRNSKGPVRPGEATSRACPTLGIAAIATRTNAPWCVDSDNTGTVQRSWLIAQGDKFVGNVVNQITSQTGNNAIVVASGHDFGHGAGKQAAAVSLSATGWSVVPCYSFGSRDNILGGVSAATLTDAGAVGAYYPSSSNALATSAEHFDRTRW